MKRYFFFILTFLFVTSNVAYAKWYIINSTTNRAVGIVDYEPDNDDLDSRGEFAVRVDDAVKIDLEMAEFFNGQIRQRVLSQKEVNDNKNLKDESDEITIIQEIMFEMAYKEAVKRGLIFKKMDTRITNKDVVDEIAGEEKLVEDRVELEKVTELEAEGKTFKHLNK